MALARGTAVGVCIGIAPLMPFKSLLILFFTVATKSSAVAAFIACTIICNPVTYVPLYYLAWLVGNFLLPGRAGWATLKVTLARMQEVGFLEAAVLAGQLGFNAIAVLLVGGLVLAMPVAFFSYPAALRFFKRRERIRSERRLNGANKEGIES